MKQFAEIRSNPVYQKLQDGKLRRIEEVIICAIDTDYELSNSGMIEKKYSCETHKFFATPDDIDRIIDALTEIKKQRINEERNKTDNSTAEKKD